MRADPTPRRGDAELLALVHSRADAVRQRRQSLRFVGLGTAAAVTLLTGIGAAAADTGNGASRSLERGAAVAAAPVPAIAIDTTTTEITTTTTIATTTTVAAPASTPTTTPPVGVVSHASVTTTPPIRATPPPSVQALVTQVFPANRSPGRIYVSARGQATGGYISRITLEWGDASPVRTFDYPASSCQAPGGGQPHDVQAADDDHAYPAPGTYTVKATVIATTCDGTASQPASAAGQVTYPSSSG